MSLSAKLKIKPESALWIIGASAKETSLFADVAYKSKLSAKDRVTQIVLFVVNKRALEDFFPKVLKLMPSSDALLWICYPKKSGMVKSDLIRDEGWQIVTDNEWECVASASIDDKWSGMRFKHQSAIKSMERSVPMGERTTEGVDYINRIVKLPPDVIKAMKSHTDLEMFFANLSFTHKREYAESIADAKKPETRARRIDKMIEMVSKLKSEKEKKQRNK